VAKIKLKQLKGSYGIKGHSFDAGLVYEVNDEVAYYLVHTAKVAVDASDKKEVPKEEKPFVRPIPNPNGKLKIGVVRIGGIGDTLVLAALAKAIRRKYQNCFIKAFVRDAYCFEAIRENADIDMVMVVGSCGSDASVDMAFRQGFDIVYDNRYATKVFYRDVEKFAGDKKATDEAVKPFEKFLNRFPSTANALAKSVEKDERAVMFETAGVVGSDEDIRFDLREEDIKIARVLAGEKYVTLHHATDMCRRTKAWETEKWEKVVEFLNGQGYKVVQIGLKFEALVKGAVDMLGATKFNETAGLIAGAKFHLDTEGGLVHLAWAVRTRSVVLFGSTPVHFFKYDANVNIETGAGCKSCWWTTDEWWRKCPEGYAAPVPCMNDISVERVVKGIEAVQVMPELKGRPNLEDVNEKFAMDLVLNETHYKAEKHQWDRIYTMMDGVVGKRVLEVGAGDGYCVEVLRKRGYEVVATEISQIRLERMRKKGIEAVYADVNKLPFGDGEFDTVICGEVLEHLDSMGQGLKELERVCKPEGKVIISLPIHPRYDPIDMHRWAIRHHTILFDGKEDLMVLELARINR